MIKRSIFICMLVTCFAAVSSYAQEKKDPPKHDREGFFKKTAYGRRWKNK